MHYLPLMEATAFIWREHVGQILTAALLSMVPTFEGRYAVTVALAMGMPAVFAYLLAFVVSSIPVPIILLLLRPVLDWFYTLPWKPIRAFAAWLEKRAANKRKKMRGNKKRSKRFSRDTWELLALYAFVAVPLPGTGVWTGALIATLFEMPRLKSFFAIILGNATACLITTLLTSGVIAVI